MISDKKSFREQFYFVGNSILWDANNIFLEIERQEK